MAQKNLEISALLDIYAPLLSEKQRLALDYYYNEDLSLSEIAEHAGISRQGVRDQIQHAVSQLINYESSLMLYDKSRRTDAVLDELEQLALNENNNRLSALIKKLRVINE